jgi:two-component system, OmpR family, response regulator
MSVPQRQALDTDVYALTRKAVTELNQGSTALAHAELDLLVRMDGTSTVAAIKQVLHAVRALTISRAVEKLVSDGLLCLVDPQDLPIEFTFSDAEAAPLPAARLAELQHEAGTGASTLDRNGYFVSIARRGTRRAPRAPQGRPSAVIVEDEPIMLKLVDSVMRASGFETRLASNRQEIVAVLRRTPPPDVVLLDVMLPDADGFDILGKLRQHPVLCTVPVIMLTAKATRQAVLKGLTAGADGYITKPFEVDVLQNAVRAVLGQDSGAAGTRKGSDGR